MEVNELIRKEGLRRGLRPRTIQTYQQCTERFFRTCRKEPFQVRKDDIKAYLDILVEKKAPGNTINVYLNALKFFYEEILQRRLTVNIRFSKTAKKLPDVLSQEEIKELLAAIENRKHLLLVKLLYSSGMRISELLHLKVKDLNLDVGSGWVRDGKGGKDRPFIIAAVIREELREWINLNHLTSDSWLFTGNNGSPYDDSSVREILKSAARKAGLKKKIYPHLLRHSFATHLIENGYSAMEVQPLLGHSNVNTTMVYVHLAAPKMLNVRSPLDGLMELK